MPRQARARSYHSPLREERAQCTRRAILDAARTLLVEQGYGRLTMQAVAREAGVALDTVYESVGRKPVLVRLLVETAISGQDEAVPADEREYVRRILAAPTAREKIAIYADAVRHILPRLAPIVVALSDAASAYPDLAVLWEEIAERRAANMGRFADDLISTGEVRPELDRGAVADVIWSMNAPEFYTLLVDHRGWSPDRFGAWLAEAWERLLLAD